MKISIKSSAVTAALSLMIVTLMNAGVDSQTYYTTITGESTFDKMLAEKKHTVVWFYNDKNMTREDYNNLRTIYNKVANIERYVDGDNLQFLAVNASSTTGRKIFLRYNELNDTTLVTLPAILLFRDGKMVNNQLSGEMTKERIKSFVERYFVRAPKTKNKVRSQ